MFNKQNFCHVASNNRNEKKAGIFVYKTTDDLDTISASGYFNEKIIDLNLHDLIIHEQTDNADRTKVKYNYLAVTERTLDNVGTTVIKRDLDISIEEAIEELRDYVDETFVKTDGTSTMTGPLQIQAVPNKKLKITAPSNDIYSESAGMSIIDTTNDQVLAGIVNNVNGVWEMYASGTNRRTFYITKDCIHGGLLGELGASNFKWPRIYAQILNNGYDINIPQTSSPDTFALLSDVAVAANSGTQLTEKGVWYAKMYAATVAPSAEDGTNYADFSQTDGQGNPIIVTYNRVNGAWVQDQTITPPADYNGYVTVTSKIWDIVEQDGQQGGSILWSYNQKTFTPYPKIISFKDAHLTGNSTTDMPAQPTGQTIVNVDYLSNHTGSGKNVGDVFFTMRNDNALSGAVECNGATYNTEDFVGTGSISGLLAAGKIPYVSLAQYETLLATQGSIGVFGWDGGNTTAFRVPSLNDIFIETGTAAQIGDYIAPKIPNLKATFIANNAADPRATGIIKVKSTSSGHGWDGTSSMKTEYEMDASVASGVYDDTATTVQPNTVRYRAMVQLATGATDEALETCTQVLADVAELKYDYVTDFQAPTAQNNYTWYRKYKSGWVEQGGISTNDETPTALPITMSDTNYTCVVSVLYNSSTPGNTSVMVKTTTSITINRTDSATNASWQVSGMAAQ